MTERARTDHHSALGGWHLQISKLLVVAIIVATAATGALIVTVLTQMPSGMTPAPGPGGLPPPPPNLRPLAVVSIVTGFFVLAWLAVLVVFARDQILRQLRQPSGPPSPGVDSDDLNTMLGDLRAEIASDRERDLRSLAESMAELTNEYGERRETDGYLSGMRTATTGEPPEANVRSLRRLPKR
ncbi:hypothetical protein [Paractinoplanes globisporus]|uniref:Uncharacterized protein n=1 Tax=Paractinoplanes globisporus TaxID=113565 RepID=A0ABW6WF65_9ACTN|nr:hypothetical protein [Actinoplanes globisporus]